MTIVGGRRGLLLLIIAERVLRLGNESREIFPQPIFVFLSSAEVFPFPFPPSEEFVLASMTRFISTIQP